MAREERSLFEDCPRLDPQKLFELGIRDAVSALCLTQSFDGDVLALFQKFIINSESDERQRIQEILQMIPSERLQQMMIP
jgi:hypothetical protein